MYRVIEFMEWILAIHSFGFVVFVFRFVKVEEDGGVHWLSHGRRGFEEGTIAEGICGSR